PTRTRRPPWAGRPRPGARPGASDVAPPAEESPDGARPPTPRTPAPAVRLPPPDPDWRWTPTPHPPRPPEPTAVRTPPHPASRPTPHPPRPPAPAPPAAHPA